MILSKTLIISEGENDAFLGYKETRFSYKKYFSYFK